jgi:hypothetical protein
MTFQNTDWLIEKLQKRRINNQLDADKLRFIDVISQHVSGIIMPIIRSTEVQSTEEAGSCAFVRCEET